MDEQTGKWTDGQILAFLELVLELKMRQVVLNTVLIMWPQEILTLCGQEETKIGKMSWKINAEEIMVGITTRRCITRLSGCF